MTFLRPKQLRLNNPGDLLIGGDNGQGTAFALGQTGKVLRVIDGGLSWNDLDAIVAGHNSIKVESGVGASVFVQNSTDSAAVKLVEFASGSQSDDHFVFSSAAGSVTIEASSLEGNVDIVLAPDGNGSVVIGGNGSGLIQGEDGEDLVLLGGAGSGNLFLDGGGTGKVYYGQVALPGKEIATKDDINTAIATSQTSFGSSKFAGTDTMTLPAKTIVSSIVVMINGVFTDSSCYSVTGTTVAFNEVALDYTLDADDVVAFTYSIAA